MVTGARELLIEASVADRCTCIGGEFFAEVPAGGDACVLASILHDWDNERCEVILSKCRQAMSDHGKLLVLELVLPPGDEPFFGKWLDLHMRVMASGRERTAEEYGKLFRAAGFQLERVLPLPAGQSVVEAVPV